jgi:ATP-dependent helicase/nuclease subunit B
MNGLLLDDVKVIRGMDRSENGRYIPVKIKLDTPVSERSLATLEQFGKIFGKLDRIVAEMGTNLYKGNIQAAPAKGAKDACEYCPYDSVCGYNISGQKNIFDMKNDEVFEKLDTENSNIEARDIFSDCYNAKKGDEQ